MMIKKKILKTILLSILVLVFTTIDGMAQAIQKKDMKVLFVGFEPDMPLSVDVMNSIMGNGGMSPERFTEGYKTRLPAFKNYLQKYFTNVKTVDARNYKMEMSADYDVTIFDQVIKPWKESVREIGEDGQMNYEPAKYLTEDFDHATIFIAHTAPIMGESVGSKLDWLCLCMDADAHHIKTEHPIFQGPYDVDLTFVKKPTPDGIFHYASGQNVPKEIPMWRVQTEGYLEGKGYRIGMVARGAGFLDSPDTEYISSGVHSKDLEAVAIGRHGNFFMWGFSGSPDYMTDEAKQVFANAVVYMKQFKGKKPIVRKYNDRIAVRDPYVDGIIFNISKEQYASYLKDMEKINVQMAETVATLQKRKEGGEELTERENIILRTRSKPQPLPDWEQYVKKYAREFYKEEYIENVTAFHVFLSENREYMYSDPDSFYNLKIDVDAKALGISNRDIKILYKAVDLLESEQTEMANRILKRYTKENFDSPKDWKKWLEKNKKNLFFTDAGGYYWLVNNRN